MERLDAAAEGALEVREQHHGDGRVLGAAGRGVADVDLLGRSRPAGSPAAAGRRPPPTSAFAVFMMAS